MAGDMREEIIGDCRLILGDCREVLPTLGRFDACVTDPAYGINAARARNSQKWGWKDYAAPGWDQERTPADLITAILECADEVIVWGGNYFTDSLPPTDKWLVWDKGQTDFSLADVELAWCSMKGAARRLMYPRALALKDGKEHPTQKPLEVMKWTLGHLSAPCGVIDPLMGSGTTGAACVSVGLKFTGIERVPEYFDIACRRIEEAYRQPRLFAEPAPKPKQEALL